MENSSGCSNDALLLDSRSSSADTLAPLARVYLVLVRPRYPWGGQAVLTARQSAAAPRGRGGRVSERGGVRETSWFGWLKEMT